MVELQLVEFFETSVTYCCYCLLHHPDQVWHERCMINQRDMGFVGDW